MAACFTHMFSIDLLLVEVMDVSPDAKSRSLPDTIYRMVKIDAAMNGSKSVLQWQVFSQAPRKQRSSKVYYL